MTLHTSIYTRQEPVLHWKLLFPYNTKKRQQVVLFLTCTRRCNVDTPQPSNSVAQLYIAQGFLDLKLHRIKKRTFHFSPLNPDQLIHKEGRRQAKSTMSEVSLFNIKLASWNSQFRAAIIILLLLGAGCSRSPALC